MAGDLEKIAEQQQVELSTGWLEANFRASPGALIYCPGVGRVQVPSIVPAQDATGACVFLDQASGACKVHAVSPVGCSRFDEHLSDQDGDLRSKSLILVQLGSMAENDLYAKAWKHLDARGLRTTPLAERRHHYESLREALIAVQQQEESASNGQEETETTAPQ